MVPSEATAMPRPLLAAAVGFGAMNCCITAPVVALNSSSVTLPKVALLPHTPVSAHTATDVIKATAAQIKKRFLISLVVLQSKRLGNGPACGLHSNALFPSAIINRRSWMGSPAH